MSIKWNRREFLKITTASALTIPFSRSWGKGVDFADADLLLSPCRFDIADTSSYDTDETWVKDRWGLAIYDMSNQKTHFIKTPIVGHSVVGHPTERHKVIVISQKPATDCCEVNLLTKKVSKVFKSGENIFFIGHAQYSADGKEVFFTESQWGNSGFITKRDSSTYQIKAKFSTGGLEPHDMHVIDGGRKIIVANGGVKSQENSMMPFDPEHTTPSMSILESGTGKIVQTIDGFEPMMSARHLAEASGGETLIGLRRFAKKKKEQVALAMVSGNQLKTFSADDNSIRQMKSWLQSLAFSPKTGVVAATSPAGNCLSFWDVEKRKLKKTIQQWSPDGIALSADGRHFISTSHKGQIMFVKTDTLEVAEGPWQHVHGLNWRHNLIWKINA